MRLRPVCISTNLAPMPNTSAHTWKFFRTGGLDQVALETADDLRCLDQLDPKLWVALSCPVKGLELDEKTLALIDTDDDGRIRVPELIAAVKWACVRLKDPAELLRGAAELPLASINEAAPEGATLAASARQILASLGQKNASSISPAQSGNTAAIFSASPLNGDGIIPPAASADPEAQALIKDILACHGGEADRNGEQGVTAARIDAFFADLAAYVSWAEKSSSTDTAVLGTGTAPAVSAVQAVRAKVEDYFARCRLAAFDARSLAALNRADMDYAPLAAKTLQSGAVELTDFPLARVEAGRALPLAEGVNPAWAGAMDTLQAATITPLLGEGKTELTEQEWTEVNARLAPFETWLGSKAGAAVEKLGLDRAKALLAGAGRAALDALVAQDKALAPQFQAISDVDRLTHYYRDLRALLHNFVNFADFYSPDRLAVFQAGTLFLDSRSTELCLRVDAPTPLAAMSKAYITYCVCTRPGGQKMTIAACFTQGDSDFLFVGRHGVFYDRAGRDWDAVITSIVDNPIGIRQAFWSPYKKFLRMIEEQVAKRAAAAEAASSSKLAAAAESTANADKAKTEPPKKVDVGAVAAIGVAITGAISALTLILGYLLQLKLWQYPLVLVGLMLVISTPSMVIAWLKLRQRTLGPVLEGNGWAVNGRVLINIPFGTALTELARKPAGSKISLTDPYEDKEASRARRRTAVLIVLLLLCGAAWFVRSNAVKHADETGRARYFWQERPAPVAPPAPSAPAPTP